MVICESLEAQASLFMKTGELENAVTFLSASSTLRGVIKAPLPPRFEDDFRKITSGCRQELGAQLFDQCWKEGTNREIDQLSNLI